MVLKKLMIPAGVCIFAVLVFSIAFGGRQEATPNEFASAARTPSAIFTVVNTADAGPGSLRAAIQAANGSPGFDQITFNIAGPGLPPYTIAPLSQLPALNDPTGAMIDGLSQPGSAAGSNPPSTAVLTIEIDGRNAGAACGLWLQCSNNIIQGLVINNFLR